MDGDFNAAHSLIFHCDVRNSMSQRFDQTNRRTSEDCVRFFGNFRIGDSVGNIVTEGRLIGVDPQEDVSRERLRSIPLLREDSMDSLR